MRILVDADSCPRRIREIIVKASNRNGVPALFVANRELPDVRSDFSELIIVSGKGEAVDDYIIEYGNKDDIVVTRDIPLAAVLVEKGITVLNDRGKVYSHENVRERLSFRDFSKILRESGIPFHETNSFGKREIKAFADTFDRELRKRLN